MTDDGDVYVRKSNGELADDDRAGVIEVGTQRCAGELPLREHAPADHRVAHGAERTVEGGTGCWVFPARRRWRPAGTIRCLEAEACAVGSGSEFVQLLPGNSQLLHATTFVSERPF
jgi:hypothetical protein